MKYFSMLGALLALALFSAAGQATTIKANYSVNLNEVDPGLKVQWAPVADNPFTVNLNPGESTGGPLFKLWTNEGSIEGDDKASKPISVDFDFILPQIFNGTVSGTTVGGEICVLWCSGGGYVSWNSPVDIYFGANGDGHLKIWLFDTSFNWGLFDTAPGEEYGGTVYGKIKLIADATAVPEPGTLALFGFGLLSLAVTARRRRRRR